MKKEMWQEAGRYLFFLVFLGALAAALYFIRQVSLQEGVF